MTVFEIISLILNLLLGGTCIVTLATLKATRAKASESAKSAKIDNSEKILNLNREFIVEPIIKQINDLRKEVKKLQKSIERISDCHHADNCPVRNELQKQTADNNGE